MQAAVELARRSLAEEEVDFLEDAIRSSRLGHIAPGEATLSMEVTEPPESSWPPYSLGKPRTTRPESASFFAARVTRSRASVIDSP